MNISFMQTINYLNIVNNNLLILCKNKEERIIQYLLFCNIIRSLEDKMSNSEYITFEELKNIYASKLNSLSEHRIINESLNDDSINSIKDDYVKLTTKAK